MPQLKWGRIDVRDIGGRGLNADIRGPNGSPIYFITNGFIGPDERPYPRLTTLIGNTAATWPSGQIRYGDGGCIDSEWVDILDSNGSTSRVHLSLNQMDATRHYGIFIGLGMATGGAGASSTMHPANIPAPNTVGFNVRRRAATLWSNPYFVGGGAVATPPFLVTAAPYNTPTPSTTNGTVNRDLAGVTLVAGSAQQPGGPTCDAAGAACGEFILYTNATRWFLTKIVSNGVAGGVIPNVLNTVDPAPVTSFLTTEIDRVMTWGHVDQSIPFNSMLGVHASGTAGVYISSQCAEMFQGRILFANVLFAPKYTVAGDLDSTKWIQKRNRLCWTILPGEFPSRGPYTTNSEGLTHLQHPWNVEVNNFVDVDGVGYIYGIFNMGDNQLFIIGSEGCARLTGYLTTAVSGVNASTFDVRPIFKSPPGYGPGCGVLTANGVFYTDGNTIWRYDGNSITNVLTGAAASLFSGFRIDAGRFQTFAGCGELDAEHCYFACRPSPASVLPGNLVYNHYTGKWSYHETNGTWGGSVSKGLFMNRDTANQYRQVIPVNTVDQPDSPMEQYNPGRTFEKGQDNSTNAWQFRNNLQPSELFTLALRPFGEPGIPKRFRHIQVNYGLYSPNQAGTKFSLDVYAVYGWDGGWPDSLTDAALIANLPALNPTTAVAQLGNLPTATKRICLDDTTLRNFYGDGTTVAGWPDTISLFFAVHAASTSSGYVLQINSVDISWIEVPGMHTVMGVA